MTGKGLESRMNAIYAVKRTVVVRIIASLAVCLVFWPTAIAQTLAKGPSVAPDSPAVSDEKPGKAGPGVANLDTKPGNINAEVLKELEQMRARIQELEALLKAQHGPSAPAT